MMGGIMNASVGGDTHTWMFAMCGCSASRATECIRMHSRSVGPLLDRPARAHSAVKRSRDGRADAQKQITYRPHEGRPLWAGKTQHYHGHVSAGTPLR